MHLSINSTAVMIGFLQVNDNPKIANERIIWVQREFRSCRDVGIRLLVGLLQAQLWCKLPELSSLLSDS